MVFCSCQGAIRRGPNSCRHAKTLIAQGLAICEPVAHRAVVRDDVPGTNFRVECACGWASNIATLDREYVEARGREHVYAYSEESIEKRRKALWS